MKKILKYIGIIIVFIILLFIFIVNFSSVESNFECVGEISSDSTSIPKTIYLKLDEYRPWVTLWNNSDSDGSLYLEIDLISMYYSYVKETDSRFQISDEYSKNPAKGSLSKLSKTILIDLKGTGIFEGTCNEF